MKELLFIRFEKLGVSLQGSLIIIIALISSLGCHIFNYFSSINKRSCTLAVPSWDRGVKYEEKKR